MKNYFKMALVAFSASLVLVNCTKEDEEVNPFDADETKKEANLDKLTDDVTDIIDNQFDVQSTSRTSNIGKSMNTTMAALPSILPSCAVVTVALTQTAWTRTIDFGNGCAVFNGANLKGKLIISGNLNFTTPSQTINYSFDGFKYNDIAVTGTKTLTRTLESSNLLAAIHPVVNVNIDLTATFPNGSVYARIGTRKRELVEGYTTPALRNDNVYKVTGNWATTGPNGVRTVTITNPLKIVIDCPFKLVQGTLTLVKNNNNAVIDYGNGACDNNATYSLNGGAPVGFNF
jgi:hypothetical protein